MRTKSMVLGQRRSMDGTFASSMDLNEQIDPVEVKRNVQAEVHKFEEQRKEMIRQEREERRRKEEAELNDEEERAEEARLAALYKGPAEDAAAAEEGEAPAAEAEDGSSDDADAAVADPMDVSYIPELRRRLTYETPIAFEAGTGHPLNPRGRTGLRERGELALGVLEELALLRHRLLEPRVECARRLRTLLGGLPRDLLLLLCCIRLHLDKPLPKLRL